MAHYHTTHWPSTRMVVAAARLIGLAQKENPKEPFPFLVASLFLSFAAIETRVNELIHQRLKQGTDAVVKKYITGKLESWPCPSLEDKIVYFGYFLTKKEFDTRSALWQRFKDLKRLRDKIVVHYKLRDLSDLEAQRVVQGFSIQNEHGRVSPERIKKDVYKNLFYQELTIDRARKARETALMMLRKLNSLYYRIARGSN